METKMPRLLDPMWITIGKGLSVSFDSNTAGTQTQTQIQTTGHRKRHGYGHVHKYKHGHKHGYKHGHNHRRLVWGWWLYFASLLVATILRGSPPFLTMAEARPNQKNPWSKTQSKSKTKSTQSKSKRRSQQQQQPPLLLPLPPHTQLYRWGNFGHVSEPLPFVPRLEARLRRTLIDARTNLRTRWDAFLHDYLTLTPASVFALGVRGLRSWVFWYFSKDCLASIYEDRWHAERDPNAFFGNEGMWVSKGGHKDVVKKRIQRSKRNRQWVGLGYTPRLVWLVGVLLRGTFQCTAIPKVFNPSLTGWGAGTILGAKCTHQEWIATFMIGWFGSEYYWRYMFGCNGPPFPKPGFVGVPVFITKLRIL